MPFDCFCTTTLFESTELPAWEINQTLHEMINLQIETHYFTGGIGKWMTNAFYLPKQFQRNL